jgi:hypothetical protein
VTGLAVRLRRLPLEAHTCVATDGHGIL